MYPYKKTSFVLKSGAPFYIDSFIELVDIAQGMFPDMDTGTALPTYSMSFRNSI
jgi:hypothetical protein